MNTNPLFIAHCKPHKLVSSSTIARWLKEPSKEQELTPAAKDHGVAVADIMKTADWS